MWLNYVPYIYNDGIFKHDIKVDNQVFFNFIMIQFKCKKNLFIITFCNL